MAAPTVTNTFVNGTTISASEVNTNFSDIISALTNGTKDLSFGTLTAAGAAILSTTLGVTGATTLSSTVTVTGTATLNGSVVLGDAAGDDLTVNASLASTIPIKTTATYDIGGSTKGLAGAYFGNSTFTSRIIANTLAASGTITLPSATSTLATLSLTESLTNKTLIGIGAVTASDSNLGTIASVTLQSYYQGTFTATFNGVGFTSSQAVTVTYVKLGKFVFLDIPGKTALGSGSAYAATGSADVPSTLRPAATVLALAPVYDGVTPSPLSTPGKLYISSGGIIRFYRSSDETVVFAGTSMGWDHCTICYLVSTA